MRLRLLSLLLGVTVLVSSTLAGPADAAPIDNVDFWDRWARTDLPVVEHRVNRTWMWGPEANFDAVLEPYMDSPGGRRLVQYFDKTRMEINDVHADPSSLWYVTNGLLARELITGRMQLGDDQFQQYHPAQVHIAGDPDPNAPTYATFAPLMGVNPLQEGDAITQTLDGDGNVGNDPGLDHHGVAAAHFVAQTNHTVASVFWDFMNSTGPVHQHGQFAQDRLFQNPFYATGYPLTEPYWTNVYVGGTPKRVLVQVFERRVLTFTPENPQGWQVEAGNVGQHYFTWRYFEVGMGICSTLDVPSYVAPAWQYPEGAIGNALEDIGASSRPNHPWASYLYERAEYIRSAYHLVTAEQGCFNAKTEFFDLWVKNYIVMLSFEPAEAFHPWQDHVRTQIIIAATQPDSPIGAKIRHIEAGHDPDRAVSGPWAYWYYLVGAYHQVYFFSPLFEQGFEHAFAQTVLDYERAVAEGAPLDFGLFLAESEFIETWLSP